MILNHRQLEREMRELLQSGATLSDAIRIMHKRGYGKLLLVEPVMVLGNLSHEQAMKMVVQTAVEDIY